jgi:transposase, IS5 family
MKDSLARKRRIFILGELPQQPGGMKMRRKREAVLCFEFNLPTGPKPVVEYCGDYVSISQVLDANPEILDAFHEDVKRLSEGGRRGREGDYTSESMLRALIVQSMEGLSLRKTVVKIGTTPFLQDFLRLRKRTAMDHTFLDKCRLAIRPQTQRKINELLAGYAIRIGAVDPTVIRADTTVVDADIHYPTDSSLLWDVWRVAARLLDDARGLDPILSGLRFHTNKIKGLHLFITRYSKSTSAKRQRAMQEKFHLLIERTGRIIEQAAAFVKRAERSASVELQAVASSLAGYLPTMQTIHQNATRAQLQGETVPASERVFSLFEPHTELIQRGRRGKPIEFGHKILLCQTMEKFITDYEVFDKHPADSSLTKELIERHEKLYGNTPDLLAADKGFRPDAETFAELEELVDTLAIPSRLQDYADRMMVFCQAFRAGIEGTISVLKRAFRLSRCFFEGFNGFVSAVGWGVFSHNLRILARQGIT